MIAKFTINNTTLTSADTEYSYALPDGTQGFMIRLRNPGFPLKLAVVSGNSGTTYVNIPQGYFHKEEEIKGQSTTLYFQTTSASQVAEILSWK